MCTTDNDYDALHDEEAADIELFHSMMEYELNRERMEFTDAQCLMHQDDYTDDHQDVTDWSDELPF